MWGLRRGCSLSVADIVDIMLAIWSSQHRSKIGTSGCEEAHGAAEAQSLRQYLYTREGITMDKARIQGRRLDSTTRNHRPDDSYF